jgi:4-hydroxy-tetrahydrodipicolinate synthase
MKTFEGTFVVSVTPMTKDEELNMEAFKDNLNYYIENGVHGIAINGSTGEFATQSYDELKKVMVTAVEVVNGRIPLISGTADCSTSQVVKLTKYAEDVGIDGALIVPPYYSKIDDIELFEHFKTINDAINIPIMVYNNPWTSKIDIPPEGLAKLAELDNIKYVKESSGDITRIPRILDLTDGKMRIFCGSDNLALESFFMGATGFICVAANIFPKHMSKLYEYANWEKDYEKAKALYSTVLPLCNFLEGSGKFTQTAKFGLEFFGRKAGPPRKPFLPLSEEHKKQAEKIFKNIQSFQP